MKLPKAPIGFIIARKDKARKPLRKSCCLKTADRLAEGGHARVDVLVSDNEGWDQAEDVTGARGDDKQTVVPACSHHRAGRDVELHTANQPGTTDLPQR